MCADIIDYFPLSNKHFLRYGIWRVQHRDSLGTVLLLADYGCRIEEMAILAESLVRRGFCVVTFEWFTRSFPHAHFSGMLPALSTDFRLSLQNLKEIFSGFFLIHSPPPFYGMGVGFGGVFGLAAHAILRSQIRRFVLVSPLFAPHGHKAGGIFHAFSRFMGDVGLSGWRTNRPVAENRLNLDPIFMARGAQSGEISYIYPTLGCYHCMLDAAQLVFSPSWYEKISFPLLCILSTTDTFSDVGVAQQFCEKLRGAASITLRHGARFPFENDTPQARQFWRAFDAFIPGTGAPAPERSLEDGLSL